MSTLRSPICWMGGKGRLAPKILPLLPPHKNYVEPYGGGANILLRKAPCGGVETYNDLDEGLHQLFTVLADPDLFAGFRRRVEALPYSRQLYDDYRATWDEAETIEERAARWFLVARQSFAGQWGGSWGTAVSNIRREMANTTSMWLSTIDMLPAIHARLQQVQVENADGVDVLGRFDGPGYLAYVDPPYVTDTRRMDCYTHEMDDEDHAALVEALLGYEGAVALSAYPTPLYDPLVEAGWDQVEFDVACHAAGKVKGSGLQGEGACDEDQRRTEVLWRNPEAMRRLDRRDSPLWEGLDGG